MYGGILKLIDNKCIVNDEKYSVRSPEHIICIFVTEKK